MAITKRSPVPHTLRLFLDDPSRPADALSYHSVQGFLFAVASSPELVPTSEWIPVVFGEGSPAFETLDDASAVMGELMALYNSVNSGILERAARLPDDCRLDPDPIANLEAESPVAQWSRGFHVGHDWLTETWAEFLPEGVHAELDQEVASVLMVLTFFSSRRLAEAYLAESGSGTLAGMAELMHRLFEPAMQSYAFVGRTVGEDVARAVAPARKAAGRNAPCPCGSGRKYKKCCGAAAVN